MLLLRTSPYTCTGAPCSESPRPLHRFRRRMSYSGPDEHAQAIGYIPSRLSVTGQPAGSLSSSGSFLQACPPVNRASQSAVATRASSAASNLRSAHESHSLPIFNKGHNRRGSASSAPDVALTADNVTSDDESGSDTPPKLINSLELLGLIPEDPIVGDRSPSHSALCSRASSPRRRVRSPRSHSFSAQSSPFWLRSPTTYELLYPSEFVWLKLVFGEDVTILKFKRTRLNLKRLSRSVRLIHDRKLRLRYSDRDGDLIQIKSDSLLEYVISDWERILDQASAFFESKPSRASETEALSLLPLQCVSSRSVCS